MKQIVSVLAILVVIAGLQLCSAARGHTVHSIIQLVTSEQSALPAYTKIST
ncbi:hypothetical protein MKX03_008143, partial [Papaver bracteatum]